MPHRWSEAVPTLHGQLVTLREVAMSDVETLFTLFSDPAVTRYMAPPPPTLAKFAGFVEWTHSEREKGRSICFGVVPQGIAKAVGILQVRSRDPVFFTAEWGFVFGSHFWSTGVFFDAATVLVDFVFRTMGVNRLEARIALRNARAHAAIQKLGALAEATLASSSPDGIRRDPELLWALREEEFRSRAPAARVTAADAMTQIRQAIDAADRALGRAGSTSAAEPYPLFLFDRRRRDED